MATFVDQSSVRTLEDYVVMTATMILSLKTLQNLQIEAIKKGVLPEGLDERANVIVWDCGRMIAHCDTQLCECLEVVGNEFDLEKVIRILKDREVTKARSLVRENNKKNKEDKS